MALQERFVKPVMCFNSTVFKNVFKIKKQHIWLKMKVKVYFAFGLQYLLRNKTKRVKTMKVFSCRTACYNKNKSTKNVCVCCSFSRSRPMKKSKFFRIMKHFIAAWEKSVFTATHRDSSRLPLIWIPDCLPLVGDNSSISWQSQNMFRSLKISESRVQIKCDYLQLKGEERLEWIRCGHLVCTNQTLYRGHKSD